MNLLKFSMYPSYYIKHPLHFFRELRNSIRYAWQRVMKGYSYYDSMDMDEFLLHIIPGMLRDIANADAYPGTEPFETKEKWEDWCNSLADVFESLQGDGWTEGRNEYEEEWRKAWEVLYSCSHPNLTMSSSMTKEEAESIRELYWEREMDLWAERDKLLQDSYMELSKYHNFLWI